MSSKANGARDPATCALDPLGDARRVDAGECALGLARASWCGFRSGTRAIISGRDRARGGYHSRAGARSPSTCPARRNSFSVWSPSSSARCWRWGWPRSDCASRAWPRPAAALRPARDAPSLAAEPARLPRSRQSAGGREGAPAVRRIVVVGDSFTWGAGVLAQDAYPDRMQVELDRRARARPKTAPRGATAGAQARAAPRSGERAGARRDVRARAGGRR